MEYVHPAVVDKAVPRSALKPPAVQTLARGDRSLLSSTTTPAAHPHAQEVSFDQSVESHSRSLPATSSGGVYNSPVRAAAGRLPLQPARSEQAENSTATHTPLRNGAFHAQPQPHSVAHHNRSITDLSPHHSYVVDEDPHSALRQAVRPVSARDLEESLQLLKYDLHREMQDIIKEQIRQFSIAKVCLCCALFPSLFLNLLAEW